MAYHELMENDFKKEHAGKEKESSSAYSWIERTIVWYRIPVKIYYGY